VIVSHGLTAQRTRQLCTEPLVRHQVGPRPLGRSGSSLIQPSSCVAPHGVSCVWLARHGTQTDHTSRRSRAVSKNNKSAKRMWPISLDERAAPGKGGYNRERGRATGPTPRHPGATPSRRPATTRRRDVSSQVSLLREPPVPTGGETRREIVYINARSRDDFTNFQISDSRSRGSDIPNFCVIFCPSRFRVPAKRVRGCANSEHGRLPHRRDVPRQARGARPDSNMSGAALCVTRDKRASDPTHRRRTHRLRPSQSLAARGRRRRRAACAGCAR
jgi:hypothetical protein